MSCLRSLAKHPLDGNRRPDALPTAVGIDGCRAGWVATMARGDEGTEVRLFTDLEEMLAWRERACGAGAPVALDVPMGLPATAGPRACDLQARRELGQRWMCVFAPPDRELLGLDFVRAREVVHRRRLADPAAAQPVMAHQAINIAPKVAEADRILCADPGRQKWLLEVHPELSFRALAGRPLAPKRGRTGAEERLALITEEFPDAPRRLTSLPWPRRQVAVDDLLDAYAALWTALRFARGHGHYRELGDGGRDERGLRQRIIV